MPGLRRFAGGSFTDAASAAIGAGDEADAWQVAQQSESPFFASSRLAANSFYTPSPHAPAHDATAAVSAGPASCHAFASFSGGAGAGGPQGGPPAHGPHHRHPTAASQQAPPADDEPLRFVDDPVLPVAAFAPAATFQSPSAFQPFAAFPGGAGGWGSGGSPGPLGPADLGVRRDVLAKHVGVASSGGLQQQMRPADAVGSIRSALGSGVMQMGTPPAATPFASPSSAPPPTSSTPPLLGLGLGSLGYGMAGGMWGATAAMEAQESDEHAWGALAAAGGRAYDCEDVADSGERTVKAALAKLWE